MKSRKSYLIRLDTDNKKEFVEKYADGEYTCLLCFNKIELDQCVSHKGVNLICNRCYFALVDMLDDPMLINKIHKVGGEIYHDT